MSTYLRLLSRPAGPRAVAMRRLLAAAGAIAASLIALLLPAAPAAAIVTEVEASAGETITVGLQPRSTTLHAGAEVGGEEAEKFENPSGHSVLPASRMYAIYWDPTDSYHGDWQKVIDQFFHNMGAASGSLGSVFAIDAQYTDAENKHASYQSTFMGAYTDTDPYPTSGNCLDPHALEGVSYPWGEPDAITCLTNAQIETELKAFIAAHKLPTGMGTIFYLLTPPGVTVCLDEGGETGHCSDHVGSITETETESYEHSFCSYHSDINPDEIANGDVNSILYAAIPWIAGGLADGHLAPEDQTAAYDCQDGGFDPSSKPIEQAETPPVQQEPNQVPCPSPDGYCDTGLADLIINQIAVEQQNIVTDPLLNGWQQQTAVRNEATDECRNFFAPTLGGSENANSETHAGSLYNQSLAGGHYYLNDAFDLAALKLPYPGIPCLPGVRLEPHFTMPNPVDYGEVVGFDGMESDITLNEGTVYGEGAPQTTYATYKWNFGDGSPEVSGYAPGAPSQNSPEDSPCELPWEAPCAASAYHSYQYGGIYDVTLTVTDTGGNKASFTAPIIVNGPLPPSPEPESSPSSPTGSGGSGSSSGSTGTTGAGLTSTTGSTSGATSSGTVAKPALPAPVAEQTVMSRSLRKTTHKGLFVRYQVNEQVTGTFEVLLAASIAHRLKLHLPLATDLPAGTRPQVIVGRALLITTKGGRGKVQIRFVRAAKKRLRRLHKVSLMVKLNVRNASGATTTVLGKVNLHR